MLTSESFVPLSDGLDHHHTISSLAGASSRTNHSSFDHFCQLFFTNLELMLLHLCHIKECHAVSHSIIFLEHPLCFPVWGEHCALPLHDCHLVSLLYNLRFREEVGDTILIFSEFPNRPETHAVGESGPGIAILAQCHSCAMAPVQKFGGKH
jgi:hypothetical protein